MKPLKGVITVYLSLILMLVISIAFVSLESARAQMLRSMFRVNSDVAAETLMSGYVKPLMDQYDIFAFDAGFGENTFNEAQMTAYIFQNLEVNMSENTYGLTAEITDVAVLELESAVSENYAALIDQIVRCEKYKLGNTLLDSLKGALTEAAVNNEAQTQDRFKGELSQAADEGEEAQRQADEKQQLEESNKPGGTVSEEYTENSSGGTSDVPSDPESVEDPRGTVTDWLHGGTTALIMGERQISSKSIAAGAQDMGTDTASGIRDFMQKDEVMSAMEQGQALPDRWQEAVLGQTDTFFINAYICDYFNHMDMKEEEGISEENAASKEGSGAHALDYEAEYILCGHTSDADNLEGTLNRLLFTRTVLNLAYLYTDAAKMKTVDAAALAVSAALAVPFLQKMIKLLMMAAWAYAEGIVDCAALAEGERVPLIKKTADWNLTFAALKNIRPGTTAYSLHTAAGEHGLSYTAYLCVLLMNVPEHQRMARIVNMMNCNIRLQEGYQAFTMENAVTGITFSADALYEGMFWTYPAGMTMTSETQYSYCP